MDRRSTAETVDFHRHAAHRHAVIANALENGTYDVLMSYDQAYVPVGYVAERLGVSPQAANNRLMKLVNAGVVRRQYAKVATGGRGYEYHWIAEVGRS